ncbi:MAG: RNA methyltransferase [Victivallaceae bacterium]|nr:RNA methyltransferase [Victivallaceae bacterium]MDD4180290.1 RNA methyltransferase [Victivallaceae bacterium]
MDRTLTQKEEALIKSLHSRHGRKKSGRCLCEGERCCGEIFKSRPDLIELIICREDFHADFPSREIIRISDKLMAKLSPAETPPGVLMLVQRPAPPDSKENPSDPFALVLDRVADPGNFGTIIRTAKAAGLNEIWYTDGSADPFSDKVIRSAMSAQFTMKLWRLPNLEAVKKRLSESGYKHFFRTDPSEGESCFKLPGLFERSAVIIGSEAHGVSPLADAIPVTIPMPGGFESLNAAQAATIFIFEYVRRTQNTVSTP